MNCMSISYKSTPCYFPFYIPNILMCCQVLEFLSQVIFGVNFIFRKNKRTFLQDNFEIYTYRISLIVKSNEVWGFTCIPISQFFGMKNKTTNKVLCKHYKFYFNYLLYACDVLFLCANFLPFYAKKIGYFKVLERSNTTELCIVHKT